VVEIIELANQSRRGFAPIAPVDHEAVATAVIAARITGVAAAAPLDLHVPPLLERLAQDAHSSDLIQRGQRAPLLAHPEVSAKLWNGTLIGGMEESREGPARQLITRGFDDFFDLKSLNETQSVRFGPFTIECRMTLHSIPTTAFRISASGRVFGFSSDTAWDPSLIDWLAPADLIVHEVTSLEHSELHTPLSLSRRSAGATPPQDAADALPRRVRPRAQVNRAPAPGGELHRLTAHRENPASRKMPGFQV
jgi:hypothetical protein